MRWLLLVLLALPALADEKPWGRFQRFGARGEAGRTERGLWPDDLATLQAFTGEAVACTGAVPTALTGQTMSYARTGVAECYSNDGQTLTQLSANQPTLMTGDINSTKVGYLPEPLRLNAALWSRDLSNAAWVKTSMTCAKTATGMRNDANGASTCTASGANGTVVQTVVLASTMTSRSLHIKRRTGTGTVAVTYDGTNWLDITSAVSAAKWKRVVPIQSPGCIGGNCITVIEMTNTQANPAVGIRLGTSGDAVDVDFAQIEYAPLGGSDGATTPIATTTVAAQRNEGGLLVDLGAGSDVKVNDQSMGFTTTGPVGLGMGAYYAGVGIFASAVSFTDYSWTNASWALNNGTQWPQTSTCFAGNAAGTIVNPVTLTVGVPFPIGRNYCSASGTVGGKSGINVHMPSTALTGVFGNLRYVVIGSINTGANALGAVIKDVCLGKGAAKCAGSDPAFPGSSTDIIWIGDSIVEAFRSGARTPPVVLNSLLGGSRTVHNGGVSGASVPGDANRKGCVDTYNATKGLNAQTLVWSCGVNSAILGASNADAAAAQVVLADARARGMKVIITGIMPFNTSAGWSAGAQTQADGYNASMSTWAGSNGATFVSTASLGSGTPATLLPAYDSGDHIHPNADGSIAFARLVQAASP